MLTRDPPANHPILRLSPVAVSSLAVERGEGAGSHQPARCFVCEKDWPRIHRSLEPLTSQAQVKSYAPARLGWPLTVGPEQSLIEATSPTHLFL